MMKNLFAKWYATNLGRIVRRIVVVGISSVVGYLMASGKLVITPEGLVDSVLGLTGADLVFSLKLFVGSGVLAGIDKMRREGTWSWLTEEEKAAKITPVPPVENTGSEQ